MAKPMYNCIVNHAGQRPAIVFVSSRKQTRITAVDILAFTAAEGKPERFLHAELQDVQPFIDRIFDPVSIRLLKWNWILFLLPAYEKKV